MVIKKDMKRIKKQKLIQLIESNFKNVIFSMFIFKSRKKKKKKTTKTTTTNK